MKAEKALLLCFESGAKYSILVAVILLQAYNKEGIHHKSLVCSRKEQLANGSGKKNFEKIVVKHIKNHLIEEGKVMNTVKIRNLEIGKGMPKIRVPIVGRTKQEILESAKEAIVEHPDVVEWRADWYTEVFRWECVEYMLQGMREILGEIPLLFTFRTQQEGGEQAIELLAYQELNERAAGTKLVDPIDAELSSGEETVKKLIKTAHDHQVKAVVSNHDFEKDTV